jgi:hypothetical protein
MNIEHRTLNVEHRILYSVYSKKTEQHTAPALRGRTYRSKFYDSFVIKSIKRSVINIRCSMLTVRLRWVGRSMLTVRLRRVRRSFFSLSRIGGVLSEVSGEMRSRARGAGQEAYGSEIADCGFFISTFRIFSRGIVPPYRTTTGPKSTFISL